MFVFWLNLDTWTFWLLPRDFVSKLAKVWLLVSSWACKCLLASVMFHVTSFKKRRRVFNSYGVNEKQLLSHRDFHWRRKVLLFVLQLILHRRSSLFVSVQLQTSSSWHLLLLGSNRHWCIIQLYKLYKYLVAQSVSRTGGYVLLVFFFRFVFGVLEVRITVIVC